jgi:hypothetical protein
MEKTQKKKKTQKTPHQMEKTQKKKKTQKTQNQMETQTS